MKKLSLVAITTLVGLFGFQPQGEAAPTARASSANTSAIRVGTDLRCKLEAFTDANATQPLPNNAIETNLGDVWVRATVRNVGSAEAKAFANTLSILRYTTSVHESSPQLTIPGGYSMVFPLVKVGVGHEGKMTATLKVDVEGQITETNEINNTCTFKVTSQKLY